MLSPMAAPDLSAFDNPRYTSPGDGPRIATYDLGGDGPDLLLVHATGFCAGVWGPVAALLDDFRVTALDVRGHGRSAAPDVHGADQDRAMSWAGTGVDVLTAVDSLGLTEPVAAGHSMGGASILIAQLARPGTFRALWGFEPIVMPPEVAAMNRHNPLAEGARRRRPSFRSAQAAIDNFASKPPLSALAPDALAAYVRYGFQEHDDGSVTLRCSPEVESATYQMGSQHHTFERLGELEVPVTVARGNVEQFGPAAFAALIAEGLPLGVLEAHDELGHFGPLEDPATTAASIRAALG